MRIQYPAWSSLILPSGVPPVLIGGALWPYLPEAGLALAAGGLVSFIGGAIRIGSDLRKARRQLRLSEQPTAPIGSSLLDGLLSDMGAYISELPHSSEVHSGVQTTMVAGSQADLKHHVRMKELKRLESAVMSISDPLFILDTSHSLVFSNRAGEELLRIRSQDGVGAGLELFPELIELGLETCRRCTASRTRQIDLTLATSGGRIFYRATGVNLQDGEGATNGVLIVLRDSSGEIQQKTRHAEFVSSVSHELKTPLASIKAFLELISDGDVEDETEQAQLFGLMDLQIDRLTRLINNMLNLSRIESGVVQVRREDCELNDILVKVMEVITPVAMEKGISIKSELSELFVPVHVDRDLFSQAIINLMSNAVKYTPQGGEVRLRSRLQEGEAVIEVRDTGMGIPEDSLPRIFERFYRVPENNQAAAGTGLGLAFVQYIVTDVHGGRITVSSQVGEGSCFTIGLPAGHQKKFQVKHVENLPLGEDKLLMNTTSGV